MGTSVSQTTGIMVTKILAILGLMLFGNCYAQWVTLSGYGGHSNPTWDYKPNFKPSSISEIFGGNSMRSVMRQIAKRSAADANPDFDHFSATRGKRSEYPDFDHFSATRGKRSEDPDFDHFLGTRGKRSEDKRAKDPDFDHFLGTRGKRSDANPDFDHFSATRGKRSGRAANPDLDHLLATRWYLGSL